MKTTTSTLVGNTADRRSEIRHRNPTGVARWAYLFLTLFALVLAAPSAEATHFRYANLSFTPTNTPGQVKLNGRIGVRGDWFGALPAVGSTTAVIATIQWGDGFSTNVALKVVSVSASENWFIGDIVDSAGNLGVVKTYTGQGPYLAGINICCRITYQNGGQSTFLAKGLVRPFSGNNSPVSSMVPVLYVPQGPAATFTVPATDPDGDGVRFRMATAAESNAAPPQNMSINSATGVVTWNNVGLATNLPYMAQFIIEDVDLNGTVKSSIPVECVVNISTQAGVAPELEVHTHMQGQPAHGPITVPHGTPVSFEVEAHDADPNATVTLNTGGLPQGASMTPTLPRTANTTVSSVFAWTPTQAQVGTHVISYSVIDNTGYQTLTSMTVNVIQRDIIAANDSYATSASGTLNVPAPGVLGNDVSQDGNALTSFLVSNPLHGTLTFNPNGSFTYSPNGYVGAVSFTYKATDGTVQSNAATVLIEVTSQPPIALAGSDVSVNEGDSVVLDGSASTPAGSLSYAWSQVLGTPVTLSGANTATPSFNAPDVGVGNQTLTFALTVTANGQSSTDTVNVAVINVNHPPVAAAGADQTVNEGSPVSLDGSQSFDIDQDSFSYSWTQVGGPSVTLTGAGGATPTFDAPEVGTNGAPGVVATLVFELVVDDGHPADQPAPGFTFAHVRDRVEVSVTNTNNPPTARAGGDQTVDENTPVALDASGSTDPDSDTLSYFWTHVGGPAVTLSSVTAAAPSFTAPFVNAGGSDIVFEVRVDDGYGGVRTDTVVVHVQNQNDPPLASAAQPSVAVLWPPNHRMVAVSVTGVSDPDNNATITINSVRQDEPTSGLGSGDTAIDAVINPDGTVLLRAERAGNRDGRVYRISFTASDAEGSASGTILVTVPHSVNRPAIDSFLSFDSTL